MRDKRQHARKPGDGKEVVKAQPAAPVQPPGGFHLPGLPALPSVNPDQVGEILRATPGLLKVAAGAWWRGAEWMVKTSVRTGLSVARELANGEPAATVIRHQTAELRSAG